MMRIALLSSSSCASDPSTTLTCWRKEDLRSRRAVRLKFPAHYYRNIVTTANSTLPVLRRRPLPRTSLFYNCAISEGLLGCLFESSPKLATLYGSSLHVSSSSSSRPPSVTYLNGSQTCSSSGLTCARVRYLANSPGLL